MINSDSNSEFDFSLILFPLADLFFCRMNPNPKPSKIIRILTIINNQYEIISNRQSVHCYDTLNYSILMGSTQI